MVKDNIADEHPGEKAVDLHCRPENDMSVVMVERAREENSASCKHSDNTFTCKVTSKCSKEIANHEKCGTVPECGGKRHVHCNDGS